MQIILKTLQKVLCIGKYKKIAAYMVEICRKIIKFRSIRLQAPRKDSGKRADDIPES